MFGYGQAFFTQAALLLDDVNTYPLLLEGISKLIYDGEVIIPLAYEFNPWIIHECYNYGNYFNGKDHSFGVLSEGEPGIMDNPGDEGNLVHLAEGLKVFRLIIGIDYNTPPILKITPRLLWRWDGISVEDYPVIYKKK